MNCKTCKTATSKFCPDCGAQIGYQSNIAGRDLQIFIYATIAKDASWEHSEYNAIESQLISHYIEQYGHILNKKFITNAVREGIHKTDQWVKKRDRLLSSL